MESLTVNQLIAALTKLVKKNPKAGDMLAVTTDAEGYDFLTIEDPMFTCGNYTVYDNEERLFLTKEDFEANENGLEYVENAIRINY